MNKFKLSYILIFAGLIFGVISCRKDQIDLTNSNDPIFTLQGTFDGDMVALVAGDNNAYMHTGIDEENGVSVFTGKLDNSQIAFQLSIFDGMIDRPTHKPLANIPTDPIFALNTGSTLAHFSKNDFPNAALINQVEWSLDGNFIAVDSFNINQPGRYNVCANVEFYDGSTAMLCNDIIVGYQRSANARMMHYLNPEGALSVWLETDNQPINKVRWFMDGIQVSDEMKLSEMIDDTMHTILAEIQFVNGTVRKKSMIVDGALSGKFVTDFTAIESQIAVLSNRDYNLRLRVFNDGKVFSSLNVDNASSVVDITEVKYYGLNNLGQEVYKIKADVIAKVSEYQGGPVKDIEFTTSFGIAIEN